MAICRALDSFTEKTARTAVKLNPKIKLNPEKRDKKFLRPMGRFFVDIAVINSILYYY